jgi:hypothetical protein
MPEAHLASTCCHHVSSGSRVFAMSWSLTLSCSSEATLLGGRAGRDTGADVGVGVHATRLVLGAAEDVLASLSGSDLAVPLRMGNLACCPPVLALGGASYPISASIQYSHGPASWPYACKSISISTYRIGMDRYLYIHTKPSLIMAQIHSHVNHTQRAWSMQSSCTRIIYTTQTTVLPPGNMVSNHGCMSGNVRWVDVLGRCAL